MSGPLSRVLEAVEGGAVTVQEVEARTGLSADVVRAGVEHLVRMGRVAVHTHQSACAPGGCGSCGSASAAGSAKCGSSGAPVAAGPTSLVLQRRRP